MHIPILILEWFVFIADAIILAVAHDIFKNMTEKELRLAGKENHILFDVKYLKNSSEVDGRL